MDGFFDKYGRVIIIAVTICFVLLFLTPMRNVVGSSINGFAGNFANKVGESLGTVKMPDECIVKSGDLLKIEGNQYIVLEGHENQALVMMDCNIGKRQFQSTNRSDGQNINTYEGSEIDNYLENEWYNGLPSTMKAAIQATNIKQASYKMYNDLDSKQETGPNGQIYNTINRHVFLPSLSEIGKAVDLKNSNKVHDFVNLCDFWTRDSLRVQDSNYNNDYTYAMILHINHGLYGAPVMWNHMIGVYPAFVIVLSKVDYTEVGHVDYK